MAVYELGGGSTGGAGPDTIELADRLGGLVVFRDLLDDPALREIAAVLSLCLRIAKQGYDERIRAKLVRHVAAFEAALFQRSGGGYSLSGVCAGKSIGNNAGNATGNSAGNNAGNSTGNNAGNSVQNNSGNSAGNNADSGVQNSAGNSAANNAGNWTEYLTRLVMESENVCIRTCGGAGRGGLSPVLLAALDGELDFLQALSQLRLSDLPGLPDWFTPWEVSETDLPSLYRARMENVGRLGYGMFTHSHVFTLAEGKLVPVRHPDPQTLDELPGYEPEREKIIANTEALLSGQPANNVLLYGDAGTGKSSTVKALVNEYAGRGLRLVEVKKNQLYELPALMDELAENPLKFILFIDDLSFTSNDDNFAALKAILEGSAGGRAENVAVYATSNRRHLIKETLSDRAGDDIHASDTRQELMSLAARFGLTVTFSSPDRDRFLYIVRKLAERYGLTVSETALGVRAEAFAIRSGGRSARVAKQFVELCKAGIYSLE